MGMSRMGTWAKGSERVDREWDLQLVKWVLGGKRVVDAIRVDVGIDCD